MSSTYREIFDQALGQLRTTQKGVSLEHGDPGDQPAGLEVVITDSAGHRAVLEAHIFGQLDSFSAQDLKELSRGRRSPLLLAERIGLRAVKKLIEYGVSHADTQGNCYLALDAYPSNARAKVASLRGLFGHVGMVETGLLLLSRPELRSTTDPKAAGALAKSLWPDLVDFETCGAMIREQGLLPKLSREFLDLWAAAFDDICGVGSQSLPLETLDPERPDWWRDAARTGPGGATILSGEVAAVLRYGVAGNLPPPEDPHDLIYYKLGSVRAFGAPGRGEPEPDCPWALVRPVIWPPDLAPRGGGAPLAVVYADTPPSRADLRDRLAAEILGG